MRVLFLQNWPIETLSLFESILKKHGTNLTIHEAFNSGEYPSLESIDGVIVGGTPISVSETRSFLSAERGFLTKAIEKQIPILGICGGAQLLASVLGARVFKNPTKEVGISDIFLTEQGKKAGIFKDFPQEFHGFQWHGETFTLPQTMTHLAFTDQCKHQAFIKDKCVGLQFHLELQAYDIDQWAEEFLAFPQDNALKSQLLEEIETFAKELDHLAHLLIRNFLLFIDRNVHCDKS